ncbi:hypothetical protein BOH72_05310 [Mycobacterium sp. WY10]|nr:hypothetical protein BOH72_05310 [Mycobacterium sp. WY10]
MPRQSRQRVGEYRVERMGGDGHGHLDRCGHQDRRHARLQMHVVQNDGSGLERALAPTDVGGGDPHIVQLADGQPPDIETRIEFGDGQRDVPAVESHGHRPAHHEPLDGHEHGSVRHRGPGAHRQGGRR